MAAKAASSGTPLPHAPAEQLRILALQQADEGLLLTASPRPVELVLKEGHEDHIQLEHAAAAGPLQAGLHFGVNIELSLQRPGMVAAGFSG